MIICFCYIYIYIYIYIYKTKGELLQHLLFTVSILWYISIRLMWCNRGCITTYLVEWYYLIIFVSFYILTENIFVLSSHKYYLKQIYLSRYIEVCLYLLLCNQMLQRSLTIFT